MADLPVVEVDGTFHNLIPSRFPTIRPYARIANGRDDAFAAIEDLTNPRLREKERLTRGLAPVDQNLPRFQNWNQAPFTYANPEGSRFFGPERPVLELAADLQTALAIAVLKRETFLQRTAERATGLEMRALCRPVTGRFLDARGWEGGDDPHRRTDLGRSLEESGVDGILFNPAERPSATGIVVLHPGVLGWTVQGEHFKFVWDGSRVEVLYAFGTGAEYQPDQLGRPEQVLAA